MKIELVLNVDQSLATLKELQSKNEEPLFILEGAAQTNVLSLGSLAGEFKAPLTYDARQVGSALSGQQVFQIDFKYNDLTEDSLPTLLDENAVFAQNGQQKAAGMLWFFFDDQAALNAFLASDRYQQIKAVIRDGLTSQYANK